MGLLRWRAVRSLPELTIHVGKESNRLEAVEAGLEHDPDEVWTEYADPRRDPWRALVLPVLRMMSQAEVARAVGISVRRLRDLLKETATPRAGTHAALVGLAADFAREALARRGEDPPADDLTACAAHLAVPRRGPLPRALA